MSRWRTPLLAALAVVAIGVATALIVQHRGDDRTAAGTDKPRAAAACDPQAIPTPLPPLASRVKEYLGVDDLAADATNVVIAEPTGERGELTPPEWAGNPNVPGSPTPYRTAQLKVDQVIAGTDIADGALIDAISSGTTTSGEEALSAPARYLLFLAPFTFGPEPDGSVRNFDTYGVVGGIAGMFAQPLCETGSAFQRLDPESLSLPETVHADALTVTPGWSDATYLESVAAGVIPELISRDGDAKEGDADKADAPPSTHAEPFDCGEATTTDQVLIDGWVRAGVNGDRFCAETGGGNTDIDVQHAEAPISDKDPLLAFARADNGSFMPVAAGLVDASVTRVLSIRAGDDTTLPSDVIKDTDELLHPLPDGRGVFQVTDTAYTVAVVLYADGTEVGRFPLPVSEAAGTPEGAEKYDIRTDLGEPRPMPWSAWQQVGESTVRLFFLGGPAVCYGAVVTVQADADAVRIGLTTGWKPETDACTDNLVSASVDVPLGEPLAGRPVEPLLP